MTPVVIYSLLLIFNFGVILGKDGQTTRYSFWYSVIGYLPVFACLYYGNFFAPLGFHP